MSVLLVSVPYHLGAEGVGVGGAPAALLHGGAAELLRADGHVVETAEVRLPPGLRGELEAVVEIAALLADQVSRAVAAGSLPVVLGGDCNVALGVLAGLGTARTGVVWFDAHGDFNTPETSPSGFLDGMPLAMACGRCERQVWERLGDAPVAEAHVVHVGGRDFDPEEQRALSASRVNLVTALRLGREGVDEALAPALACLAGRGDCRPRQPGQRRGVDDVYLHLDIDVVDPSLAPASDFTSPGGLDPDEVVEAARAVSRRFRVGAVSLTAFDPAVADPEGRTLSVALDLLRELVALAAGAAPRRP